MPGRQITQLRNGQKTWIDTLPMRTYRGSIDIWKKKRSTLIIREMQTKTSMKYHLTPVRIATINKSTDSKCWRGCREKGTLVHCWWKCRLLQPLWKIVWNFLRKLKMERAFDPAIPLLGLYPKNPDTPIQKNLCTPMFIVAQFTITKC